MALRRHVTAFEEHAEVLATMDLGKLWDRYLGEFLGEWERLNRLNLPDDELERRMMSFIDGLSDKPTDDLARQTAGVAYNDGRSAEILTAAAKLLVEYVVRSEILDANTCQVCQDLDGSVFRVGSDDYYRWRPPAGCLGGDRCRGFYVPISTEIA